MKRDAVVGKSRCLAAIVLAATPAVGADGKLSPSDLDEMLAKAGDAHNLDVDLLASLVKRPRSGGQVPRHPPYRETRAYVARVIHEFNLFRV